MTLSVQFLIGDVPLSLFRAQRPVDLTATERLRAEKPCMAQVRENCEMCDSVCLTMKSVLSLDSSCSNSSASAGLDDVPGQ